MDARLRKLLLLELGSLPLRQPSEWSQSQRSLNDRLIRVSNSFEAIQKKKMRGKENAGRQGKWFLSVKKLFAAESHRKNLKNEKSRETWDFSGSKDPNLVAPEVAETTVCDAVPQLLPPPATREAKVSEEDGAVPQRLLPLATQEARVSEEEGQSKHAYSVVLASPVAAEAADMAPQAAATVVHLTVNSTDQAPSKWGEETAAIKIQTAFRGYMAKRTLRDMRGLARLKELVDGDAVRRQTTNTMHVMQALSKVQSHIRSRKIRMWEDDQSLGRQLQLKVERELEKLKTGGEWNDSHLSKEKMQAKQVNKQEAAMRRERALAYAFSHQWKSSSRALTPGANSPQWNWSWVDRWMATRPWESRSAGETSDQASTKSLNHSMAQETVKANVQHDTISECTPAALRSRPASRHLPSAPPTKLRPPTAAAGNKKSASTREVCSTKDDDSRILALQRARMRRYSIGNLSDVSSGSSSAIPSYVTSTATAAKAKPQLHSPLKESAANLEKGPVSLMKNRLSFPSTADKHTVSSPTNVKRHLVPPKVDVASLMDATANGRRR